MKKAILIFICVLSCLSYSWGQRLGIKTNLLYWATATPNIGVESAVSKKLTIHITGAYNMFSFKNNKQWKHYLIKPELRYWLCESFYGHFLGLHTGYGNYNISGIPLLYAKDGNKYRYDGWLTGVGLSYGYQWIVGDRWNIEATLGVGYIHTQYDKYDRMHHNAFLGSRKENYIAPTQLGISIIYFIR